MKNKIRIVSNIIILNKKILLVSKNTSKYNFFISGKIEENENHDDALIRETYEETGLKVVNFSKIGKANIEFPDKIIEMIIYKTSEFSGTLNSIQKEGINSWHSLENLDELNLLNCDKIILNMIDETNINIELKEGNYKGN